MDDLFVELVGVDSNRAFNFFLTGLRDVTNKRPNDEMFYIASVLGHYAQTSCKDEGRDPSFDNLSEIFDNFIYVQSRDPEILEIGGSQVILFAGFFRDQMRRRHNVRWYDELGRSLYHQAGALSSDWRKRELFEDLAESLPYWTSSCRDLSRRLNENRFLLRSD